MAGFLLKGKRNIIKPNKQHHSITSGTSMNKLHKEDLIPEEELLEPFVQVKKHAAPNPVHYCLCHKCRYHRFPGEREELKN